MAQVAIDPHGRSARRIRIPSTWAEVVWNAVFVLLYIGAAKWSLRYCIVADGASLIWLPTGLALGAVLLKGRRLLPAVFIAAVISNWAFTRSHEPLHAILIGCGNAAEAFTGWWLLRRVMGFENDMQRAGDGVSVCFGAAPLAPLASALVGTAVLCSDAAVGWGMFWRVFAVWYVGDAISILLLTPLVVCWARPLTYNAGRMIEALVLALLVVLIAFTAFGRETSGGGSEYPLAFLPLPLVVWGAMRFGPRGASALSFTLCVISAWATINGRGPFDSHNIHDSIKLLWAFMAVAAGMALCLSTASAESRRAVATLRESRERYRLLVEGSGVIAWEFDPIRNCYTYVSGKAEALLGYPRSDWQSPGFRQRVLHRDDCEQAGTFCQIRSLRGEDHAIDYRMLAANGRVVSIHDIVTVVMRDGKPVQYRGVMLDVTERRQAQEQLALTERKFRTLFEQSPYGVMIVDPAGGIIMDSNAALCDLVGYEAHQLRGRPVNDFEACETPSEVLAHADRIMREGSDVFETRLRRKDGVIIDVLVGARLVNIGQRTLFNCIVRDITAQKRSVATIRASEERFRSMFEKHDSIMLLIDHDTGAVIDANEAAAEYYGYSRERLRAMRVTEVMQGPGEDARGVMAEAAAGRQNHFESRHKLGNGEVRDVEIHSSPLDYAGKTLLFWIIYDVTERKLAEAERDRLQAQVLHAQKLESLGVLAGGIAHDFNNLLVGILGNAGLAMQTLPPEAPARPLLRTMEHAAQRAADLTRQLLAYAGKGRLAVEPVDLSELMTEMAQLMDVSIARTADVTFALSHNLPKIEADATQLRQVVMNLLTNASDALEGKAGVIRIATGQMFASRAYLSDSYVASDEPEGEFAFLEVSDTGKGMDSATLERIFDPFFTTKFTGRGLGLAAALGIVKAHRGVIKVSSKPGSGTHIRVLFPVSPELAVAPREPEPLREPKHAGDSRRVLVVDDEKLVRDMASAAISAAGYTTVAVADGDAAIESLQRHNGSVAAVLLDMTMPGLSGPAVMHRMRDLGLYAPVILTSGYAEQEVLDSIGDLPPAAFLQKPYTTETLVRTVRRVASAER